jgi:hypothetical protein
MTPPLKPSTDTFQVNEVPEVSFCAWGLRQYSELMAKVSISELTVDQDFLWTVPYQIFPSVV